VVHFRPRISDDLNVLGEKLVAELGGIISEATLSHKAKLNIRDRRAQGTDERVSKEGSFTE
jgi:hypothetical protein